jgi:hypothetical protein
VEEDVRGTSPEALLSGFVGALLVFLPTMFYSDRHRRPPTSATASAAEPGLRGVPIANRRQIARGDE